MNESSRAEASKSVTVVAPARLHMGFLDPGGSLGRHFGSIGVALNEIATRVTLRRGEQAVGSIRTSDREAAAAQRIARIFGFPADVQVSIDEAIPAHVGLGSGTQLALAIGVGLQRLHGCERSVREVAHAIGRGKRSGIGIAVFEHGGFIVDGGRGPNTVTPPCLARFEVPTHWRFILVFDTRGQGLHGERELAAFRALPPFPAVEAARLCHLLLLRGLPALAEQDLGAFGAVISEIQGSVGDYFAAAQGGRVTSPDVAECLSWLQAKGAVGVGQTSWGPTGFCLLDSDENAQKLATAGRERFAAKGNLRLAVVSARNAGATVLVEDQPETQTSPSDRPSLAAGQPNDLRSRRAS